MMKIGALSSLRPPMPIQPPSFASGASRASDIGSVAGVGGVSPGNAFSLTAGQPSIAQSSPSGKLDRLTGLVVDQVKGVNALQGQSDAMVHSMLTGGDVNEAEVLTAVQKADLAFRMMMQIRNKLMEAYREVQQIQI